MRYMIYLARDGRTPASATQRQETDMAVPPSSLSPIARVMAGPSSEDSGEPLRVTATVGHKMPEEDKPLSRMEQALLRRDALALAGELLTREVRHQTTPEVVFTYADDIYRYMLQGTPEPKVAATEQQMIRLEHLERLENSLREKVAGWEKFVSYDTLEKMKDADLDRKQNVLRSMGIYQNLINELQPILADIAAV
jgi:hypothetical protein